MAERRLAPGYFWRLHLLMAFWTVLPLALMHYLDQFAQQAIGGFRPSAQADDFEFERLW